MTDQKELQKAEKFELTQGEQYFIEKLNIPAQELSLIKTQIAPGISDKDLWYCLEIAKRNDLNVFANEIYFIPRRLQKKDQYGNPMKDDMGRIIYIDKHSPLIGRDGARKAAKRKGMKILPRLWSEIKKVPQLINNKWQLAEDLVGIAELDVEGSDKPIHMEAYYSEYKQVYNGNLNKFWAEKPNEMIQKVAEFKLLKFAYGIIGESIDGGYLDDEQFANQEAETKQEAIIDNDFEV